MTDIRHSYSSLSMFHQCPRQWAYRYREGYERLGLHSSLHALRGTAFHSLVQADLISRGAKLGSLLDPPATIEPVPGLKLGIDWPKAGPTIIDANLGPEVPLTPFSVLCHIEEWEKAQEKTLQEAMKELYGDTLTARLRELWTRYTNHYADQFDNLVPLIVEYMWAREAPNGKVLQGRVDAVVYNKHLGLIQIFDTKTHQSWPEVHDDITELFDSQLHLGAWGVAEYLLTFVDELKKLGIDDPTPRSTVYDRVRWKMPSTPKLTARGTLNKTITDFAPETYEAFCRSEEAVAAGYEMDYNVLAAAGAEGKWFRRKEAPVNINIIRGHILGLQHLAAEADNTQTDTAPILPSKDACKWCDFRLLCVEELRGGRKPIDDDDLHLYELKRREA